MESKTQKIFVSAVNDDDGAARIALPGSIYLREVQKKKKTKKKRIREDFFLLFFSYRRSKGEIIRPNYQMKLQIAGKFER